jgi:hypothetical protein
MRALPRMVQRRRLAALLRYDYHQPDNPPRSDIWVLKQQSGDEDRSDDGQKETEQNNGVHHRLCDQLPLGSLPLRTRLLATSRTPRLHSLPYLGERGRCLPEFLAVQEFSAGFGGASRLSKGNRVVG